MDQENIYKFLQGKLEQTDLYHKDEQKQFQEYRKTDKMIALFLVVIYFKLTFNSTLQNQGSQLDELISVKVVSVSNTPFQKTIRALQDFSFQKLITPDIEEWVIIDRNVNYEIHHCKTKSKTDMIFGEIKQVGQNIAYFVSASIDNPSVVVEKERALTKYFLNSTVVEKMNENQSKITFILCQNISRFDLQTNNKILLESVPPYLEQLSKAFEQYPY
ncbi:hypothetical protein ABPG74_010165 [Tetrahymena malaccensis]